MKEREMTKIDLLKMITNYAVEYSEDVENSIHRNNHMNNIKETDKIDKRISDAILVDFINFIGMKQCVDYCLYTSDFKKETK
jgi:hypothetical protein